RAEVKRCFLAAQHPGEAFEAGEIHSGGESCSHRDQDDPDQPEAHAHLIPGVTPRSERQRQGRPGWPRPLLGFDTEVAGLPCTVSVPNLKTDRTAGMAPESAALNVRRLMYQTLIWSLHLRDHARCLRTAIDAQHMQGAANALVDGVRGNAEFDGDFLGGHMMIDEQQAIELALAQPRDALRDLRILSADGRPVRPPIVLVTCDFTLHQHEWPFTAKEEIKQKP